MVEAGAAVGNPSDCLTPGAGRDEDNPRVRLAQSIDFHLAELAVYPGYGCAGRAI